MENLAIPAKKLKYAPGAVLSTLHNILLFYLTIIYYYGIIPMLQFRKWLLGENCLESHNIFETKIQRYLVRLRKPILNHYAGYLALYVILHVHYTNCMEY